MGLIVIYKGIFNFCATIKPNHSTKVEMLCFNFVRIKNQNRNSKLKIKFDIDIGHQKCKMENENQKGELKMENENQKPKLSFKDVFKIKDEICNSGIDCDTCPFYKKDTFTCIMRGENITQYVDEIEAICTKWEMNKPTLAEKITEIIKPYGMKLVDGEIWFDDDYKGWHTKDALINKLYTTRWKGESNE